MQIDLLSDPECFQKLHDEWHELLARTNFPSIFFTPEFLQTWWEVFHPGMLQVITVRDEMNRLVSLAPFYFSENAQVLRFLGNEEVSDYRDVIIDSTTASVALPQLWSFIQALPWQTAEYSSLPATSLFRAFLKKQSDLKKEVRSKSSLHPENQSQKHEKTPPRGKPSGSPLLLIEEMQQNVCPVITLPPSWEEYLMFIGRKQRHEIRRKWQKLEQVVKPTFACISHNLEQQDVDDFIELHKKSSPEKNAFWTSNITDFFRKLLPKMSQAKWLKLYFLELHGLSSESATNTGIQRVAGMLGFDFADTFALYNSGIDPSFSSLSVGNILTAHTIREAIRSNKKRYDFLRGDEEYKLRFGAISEPIFNVRIRKIE